MNEEEDFARRLGEAIVGSYVGKLEKACRQWEKKYEAVALQYKVENEALKLDLLKANEKCKEQETEIQKLNSTIEEMVSDFDSIPGLVDSFADEEKPIENVIRIKDRGIGGCTQYRSPFHDMPEKSSNFRDLHGTRSENDSLSNWDPRPYDYLSISDSGIGGCTQYRGPFHELCEKNPNFRHLRSEWDSLDKFPHGTRSESHSNWEPWPYDRHSISDSDIGGCTQYRGPFYEVSAKGSDVRDLRSDWDLLGKFPHGTRSENDSHSNCDPRPYDRHRIAPNYSVNKDERNPSQPSSRGFERKVANPRTANGSPDSSSASRKWPFWLAAPCFHSEKFKLG